MHAVINRTEPENKTTKLREQWLTATGSLVEVVKGYSGWYTGDVMLIVSNHVVNLRTKSWMPKDSEGYGDIEVKPFTGTVTISN